MTGLRALLPEWNVRIRGLPVDCDSRTTDAKQAADIAAARTFRLRPENKAMHAARAAAALLYQEWLERSAALCPASATPEAEGGCPQAVEAVRASQAFERAIELASPRCKREGETRVALRLVLSDRSAPGAAHTLEIDFGERSCPP